MLFHISAELQTNGLSREIRRLDAMCAFPPPLILKSQKWGKVGVISGIELRIFDKQLMFPPLL